MCQAEPPPRARNARESLQNAAGAPWHRPCSLLPWSTLLRRGGAMPSSRVRFVGFFALALTLLCASLAGSTPISVQYQEGLVRAFPVLRTTDNDALAQGDFAQVTRGDQVTSRLIFRFKDGSLYDETVVFSQRERFILQSYRIVQRGPSFPETLEASMDRQSGRYEVRYRADEESAEEHLTGTLAIPDDAYNGMLTLIVKNLRPGASETVSIVAFTPKPRVITLQFLPLATERGTAGEVVRYHIRPKLGLFASLLVTDVPDTRVWILMGEAPAFLKAEGPLYFMGPIWRVEPH